MGEADDEKMSPEEVAEKIGRLKVLPGPRLRDPVLREAMTAVMWLRYALQSLLDGRPALARHLAELAGDSVMNTLALAETDPPPPSENA